MLLSIIDLMVHDLLGEIFLRLIIFVLVLILNIVLNTGVERFISILFGSRFYVILYFLLGSFVVFFFNIAVAENDFLHGDLLYLVSLIQLKRFK